MRKFLSTIIFLLLPFQWTKYPAITSQELQTNPPARIEDRLLPELDQLTERGLVYKLVDDRFLEVWDPITKKVHRFPLNLFDKPREAVHKGVPTLTIDLTTIDTSLYSWKYQMVSTISVVGDWGFGLKSGDLDRNGRTEVYGIHSSQQAEGTMIYELTEGNVWQHRHTFQLPPGVIGIAVDNIDDVDLDGYWEVFGINATTLYSFEQESETSLPTIPNFEFVGLSGYGIPTVLWDMQGDATKELVYRSIKEDSATGTRQDNSIARYNFSLNNFERIWSTQLPPGCSDVYCALNLAAGDYDLDGKQEFVTSAFMGNTYVVEYVTLDSFAVVWSDSLSTAGRVASGDVDGNGIEEFFVGGRSVGIRRVRAHETLCIRKDGR